MYLNLPFHWSFRWIAGRLFIGVTYLIGKWFPKYVRFFLLTFCYYGGIIIAKKWVFYWVMSSDWKRVLVSFFMFIISYRYILPSFACRITIITLKTLYLSISPHLSSFFRPYIFIKLKRQARIPFKSRLFVLSLI